nr:hypothetical protein [Corallococcus sicarius]
MKRPLPDGTTHLLFTGLELLRRLASLVPGASGKPHEVPRRLRSRRQTAAILGPSSRCAGSIARAAPSAALLGPSAPSLPLNRAPSL